MLDVRVREITDLNTEASMCESEAIKGVWRECEH